MATIARREVKLIFTKEQKAAAFCSLAESRKRRDPNRFKGRKLAQG